MLDKLPSISWRPRNTCSQPESKDLKTREVNDVNSSLRAREDEMKYPWSNGDTQKKEWIPSFLTFLYFSDPLWNKASGGDGIPVELFQILKDDAVKVLHSICQQIWKTQQWPQDCKRSVFISIPKKSNAKECSNYSTIALI